MRIYKYQNSSQHLGKYIELIANLYREHPAYAEDRIKKDVAALAGRNPFSRYGSLMNFIVSDGDIPLAHASAIIDTRLPDDVGLIGYFECNNNRGIAEKLLDSVTEYLFGARRRKIRGPVQCTTWQGHGASRSDRGSPYFSEPYSREYYCDFLEAYGFRVKQQNITEILDTVQTKFREYAEAKRSLVQRGFTFERLSADRITINLEAVYRLVSEIFIDTFCFVRISPEEFREHFGTIITRYPECSLLLVRNPAGDPVAFLWSMPDLYAPDKGQLILKTIGVLEPYRNLGIAKALFHTAYGFARKNSFRKFILSTMRSDNGTIRHLTSGTDASNREYNSYEINL